MIIKDKEKLKQVCEPCESIEEGEKIGKLLFEHLARSKKGIGLAANQIGINKRVCVINVTQPVLLINPKITKRSAEEFIFPEACLSFPGKYIKCKRNVEVTVEADNVDGELFFSAADDMTKDKNEVFETACVQHEIDHLDGITMYDRRVMATQVRSNKIGRNQKVTITDGDETKVMKYKKAKPLIDSGAWEMSDVQINVG